jgi:hypothetical protein
MNFQFHDEDFSQIKKDEPPWQEPVGGVESGARETLVLHSLFFLLKSFYI